MHHKLQKMTFESVKNPTRSASGKNENMAHEKRFQFPMKNAGFRKNEAQIPNERKMSGFFARDPFVESNLSRGYENSKVNLKTLGLSERNSKDNSEEVQKYIKHASSLMEKKTPLKDRLPNTNYAAEIPLSKYVTRSSNSPNQIKGSKLLKNMNVAEDLKHDISTTEEKYLTKKGLKRNLETIRSQILRYSKTKSSGEKVHKEHSEPTNNICGDDKLSALKWGNYFSKVPQKEEPARLHPEQEIITERNSPCQKKILESLENTSDIELDRIALKKMKPSEIPLWKNRMESTKKSKTTSNFMRRSLEGVDSSSSIDFYSKKKTISPIDEGSVVSETPSDEKLKSNLPKNAFEKKIILNECEKGDVTFDVEEEKEGVTCRMEKKKGILTFGMEDKNNIELMEEDLGHKTFEVQEILGNETFSVKEDQGDVAFDSEEVIQKDFRLNNRSRNDLLVTGDLYKDISDNSETPKAKKKLDLEMVKSTSFTILRTASNTLHRLESLHQQNVSIKESGFAEKDVNATSSKLKLLTPKNSFNSFKCPKKYVSIRSSSKGNKPVLKCKAKKKKETEANLLSAKKMLKGQKSTENNYCTEMSEAEDRERVGKKLDILMKKVQSLTQDRQEQNAVPTTPLQKTHQATQRSKGVTSIPTRKLDKLPPSRIKMPKNISGFKAAGDSESKFGIGRSEVRDSQEKENKSHKQLKPQLLSSAEVPTSSKIELEMSKYCSLPKCFNVFTEAADGGEQMKSERPCDSFKRSLFSKVPTLENFKYHNELMHCDIERDKNEFNFEKLWQFPPVEIRGNNPFDNSIDNCFGKLGEKSSDKFIETFIGNPRERFKEKPFDDLIEPKYTENFRERSREKSNEECIEKLRESSKEKSFDEFTEECAEHPREKSREKTIDKFIEKSTEKLRETFTERSFDEFIEEHTENSREKTIDKFIEKSTEKLRETFTEKSIQKCIEKPREMPREKSFDKPIEKTKEKPGDKSFDKSIQKPTEKFTVKSTDNSIEKANEPKSKMGMKSKIKKTIGEKANSTEDKSKLVLNKEDLVIRGKPLKVSAEDKPKLEIKIEMSCQEDVTNSDNTCFNIHSTSRDFDSVYTVSKTCRNITEDTGEKIKKEEDAKNFMSLKLNNREVSSGKEIANGKCSNSGEANSPRPKGLPPAPQKANKTSSLRKMPEQRTFGASIKTVNRTSKRRPDADDRWLSSPSSRLISNSATAFQNNLNRVRTESKMRGGLRKAYHEDIGAGSEKKDLFDDAAFVKLRRRSSEPNSCKGFVYKHPDFNSRTNNKNASGSSLASSLKHLNTDELEDFIFWEAVPPTMTSCWEMSLYHFKKHWSVLSFSVFKDNRLSKIPGLILENLRNGSNFSTRQSFLRKRDTGRRENSFDVEPSIGQKNIDIKNWLVALNFPTSSTSSYMINEDNFRTNQVPPPTFQFTNKGTQRRRKGLPTLKVPEEVRKHIEAKKNKASGKMNSVKVGNLKELIRRKSGGFVTSNRSVHSTVFSSPDHLTKSSSQIKSTHKKGNLQETKKQNSSNDPKGSKTKSEDPDKSPKCEIVREEEISKGDEILKEDVSLIEDEMAIFVEGQSEASRCVTEEESSRKPPVEEENLPSTRGAKIAKKKISTSLKNINVWKYLYISTILIVTAFYFFFVDNVSYTYVS